MLRGIVIPPNALKREFATTYTGVIIQKVSIFMSQTWFNWELIKYEIIILIMCYNVLSFNLSFIFETCNITSSPQNVHRSTKFRGFNVNLFFKWEPTSKSRVTYDLDTDLNIQHRHHNAQNYWSSGEPPLPRYACMYRPSEILSFTDKSSEQFAGVNWLYFPINKFFLKRKIAKISPPLLYFLNTSWKLAPVCSMPN